MSMNEYQKLAMVTKNQTLTNDQNLMNATLGLNGEAGEVADLIKKSMYQGHALDTTLIIKELGDILWYIALACDSLNTTMESVAKINIDKLKARYPQGFNDNASINRMVE